MNKPVPFAYRLTIERPGPGRGQYTTFQALDKFGRELSVLHGSRAWAQAERFKSLGKPVEEVRIPKRNCDNCARLGTALTGQSIYCSLPKNHSGPHKARHRYHIITWTWKDDDTCSIRAVQDSNGFCCNSPSVDETGVCAGCGYKHF